MQFPIFATAFEGLLLIRRRPLTLVYIAAVWFVIGLAMTLAPWAGSTPGQVNSMMGYGLIFLGMLLALTGSSILVYDPILRMAGRAKPLAAWPRAALFVFILWAMVSIVAAAGLAGLAAVMAVAEQALLPAGAYISPIIRSSVGIGIGVVAALAVGACLACAGPIAFDRHRIGLVAAWRLSRGRVGRLLATFTLTLIAVVLISGGLSALREALAAGWLHELGDRPGGGAPSAVAALAMEFTPNRLILSLMDAFISSLAMMLMIAPGARLYAAVAEETPQSRAAVFD